MNVIIECKIIPFILKVKKNYLAIINTTLISFNGLHSYKFMHVNHCDDVKFTLIHVVNLMHQSILPFTCIKSWP